MRFFTGGNGAALGAVLVGAIGLATAQVPQPLHRVHSGGEAFVDAAGRIWSADMYYEAGNLFAVGDTIEGTTDQGLYQTERWNDPAAGNLRYVFPVRDGEYQVKLHFAEIWDGAFLEGARVFDVNVQGQAVAQSLDIFARAGARKPLVLEHNAWSQEGKIAVEFFNKAGHAKISGIEVIPLAPLRATAAPYRIHCGGEDFVDAQGNYWEGDGHYAAGSTYLVARAIAGTDNSILYQTERWNNADLGNLSYAFDVAEGAYTVRLHFAEIYFTDPGVRVFSVDVNGVPALENLDIVAEAGANTALVKEIPATAASGKITIDFRNAVQNAKVSGIEILPAVPTSRGPATKAGEALRFLFRSPAPGVLAVASPSGVAFTALVRDLRGRPAGALAGKGAATLSGLKPGVYAVEARVGRKAFRRLVAVR